MSDIKNYIPGLGVGRGSSVTGADSSVQNFYATFSAQTTGTTAVSVLGSGVTAPTAGTITGFVVTNLATANGTFVLWATTAGTIATIANFGTNSFQGACIGTNVLAATVASGDTIQVSSITNAGTANCFVYFVTAS